MKKPLRVGFDKVSTALKISLGLIALAGAHTAGAQSGTTIITSGTQKVTTIGAANQVVDSNVTLSGVTAISQVTVTVASGYTTGDVLAWSSAAVPSGVTGTFNAATGTLTFNGSATTAQYQTLLRTVTISLSSSNNNTRGITFTVGTLGSFTNGHYYEFVSSAASWATAKTSAATRTYNGLTGYLATVTSAGENAYIKQTLSADGWIGASDDYNHINAATGVTTFSSQTNAEGRWYWVTGPEKGTNFSNGNSGSTVLVSGQYSNWTSGEPNNSGGAEHYCQIYSSGTTGAWNDLPSTSSIGYVIEYGGLSGDPVVQLSASRNIVVQATSVTGTYSNGTAYKVNTVRKVDSLVEVRSVSTITNAKVTVSSGFQPGDSLGFSTAALPGSVTGAFNPTTGVLSFTGTASATQFQTLFRTVTFKATSGTYANREVTFGIGNLVAYSNGNFYEFVSSTGITWANAKSGALVRSYMGKTGYLATVTSAGENAFIKQTLAADGWLGGSDDFNEINAATGVTTFANQTASEGRWHWVTGPEKGTNISNGNATPVAVSGQYVNWASGEPNNSSGNENFMQMYASGSNPGMWNDLSGTSQNGYVVEYGGLASDPTVALTTTSLITVRGDVLPVRELRLSARSGNELCWTTVNEEHIGRFELERSIDGRSFATIATESSKGDGDFSYCTTDNQAPAGHSYYRVAAFDAGGAAHYSNIVTRASQSLAASITLAPNPVTGTLHIGRSTATSGVARVLDLSGRTLVEQQISGFETGMDLSRLPAGSYLLSIQDGGGHTTKMIVRQ